jgi:hypothetical protein
MLINLRRGKEHHRYRKGDNEPHTDPLTRWWSLTRNQTIPARIDKLYPRYSFAPYDNPMIE